MLTKNDLDDYNLDAALAWYVEQGIEGAWLETPQNRLLPKIVDVPTEALTPEIQAKPQNIRVTVPPEPLAPIHDSGNALKEALVSAKEAADLNALKSAILNYPHLTIKNTASQIVFADGNPKADLMVIGDAPNSDDERAGIPFAGEVGDLLNKMMSAIGRTRGGETAETAFYTTTILKYRPPGNRTPTQFELDISLPFLKRHIELIKPKAILLMGAPAAKLLLGSTETITKLRGKFQTYHMADGTEIAVMPSFHPSYLLKSPTQKRASWDDLQALRDRLTL